ncbi:MAG: hypothetical protein DRN81_01020 [Thermoproteota archaeon]|nr:MAG: hypothetical protein DRN81_01020 [Candidatus Korarchaeota archaeon]
MEDQAKLSGQTQKEPETPVEEAASYGDFLLVDYTLGIGDTGEIYKTTVEQDAKEYGIYDESQRYGPALLILGAGWLHRNIEKLFVGMKPGETKEGVLQPNEAFGERDPRNIKTILARRLEKRGITVRVGEKIVIDGREGRIDSVSGGRVRVDFNHPLASKKIKYKITLHRILRTEEEKAEAVLNHVFNYPIRVKIKNNVIIADIPYELIQRDGELQSLKHLAVNLVSRYLKEISEVRYVEHYTIG